MESKWDLCPLWEGKWRNLFCSEYDIGDVLLLVIAKVVSGMGTPFHGDTSGEGMLFQVCQDKISNTV